MNILYVNLFLRLFYKVKFLDMELLVQCLYNLRLLMHIAFLTIFPNALHFVERLI